MLRNVTESISIPELHELDDNDYEDIIITVKRRNEPGAGDFSGIVFISKHSNIGRFDTTTEALQFIDDLHEHGVVEAIRNQLEIPDADNDYVISKLHGPTEEANTEQYINQSGMTNPMNLSIDPKIRTTEKIQPKSNSQQDTTLTELNSEHANT